MKNALLAPYALSLDEMKAIKGGNSRLQRRRNYTATTSLDIPSSSASNPLLTTGLPPLTISPRALRRYYANYDPNSCEPTQIPLPIGVTVVIEPCTT